MRFLQAAGQMQLQGARQASSFLQRVSGDLTHPPADNSKATFSSSATYREREREEGKESKAKEKQKNLQGHIPVELQS